MYKPAILWVWFAVSREITHFCVNLDRLLAELKNSLLLHKVQFLFKVYIIMKRLTTLS